MVEAKLKKMNKSYFPSGSKCRRCDKDAEWVYVHKDSKKKAKYAFGKMNKHVLKGKGAELLCDDHAAEVRSSF